jgi:hypothetical protein
MVIINNFIQNLSEYMLKDNNEKYNSSKYIMVLEKLFAFM